jgi:hydroxymethylglutaryl-CoA lyase
MMRAPQLVRDPTLPTEVTIWEVGPRDGLQNEPTVVPVEVKVELVARLLAAGLPVVEATSFVSPARVPQLADADELMARLGQRGLLSAGTPLPVLVPNERGLDRALAAGATSVAVFLSVTEAFAQANLGCGLDQQYAMATPVISRAKAAGLPVRAYLSMCFGDPWEGDVAVSQVVKAGVRVLDLGADQLSLGDTIGVGTAGHVGALVAALADAGVGADRIAMHFHDTYGQALANTLAAMHAGVTTFDASVGGLGGCPFAKSATGNLPTEDLVWMLDGLGVRTGVDLPALVAISTWLADQLGRPSPSRVVRAVSG